MRISYSHNFTRFTLYIRKTCQKIPKRVPREHQKPFVSFQRTTGLSRNASSQRRIERNVKRKYSIIQTKTPLSEKGRKDRACVVCATQPLLNCTRPNSCSSIADPTYTERTNSNVARVYGFRKLL